MCNVAPMRSKCSVEGCDREIVGRGWCGAHYNRWKKTGDVRANVPLKKDRRFGLPCSVEGCTDNARCRGMCDGHYQRWHKTGEIPSGPLKVLRRHNGASCEVEGCKRLAQFNGLCSGHYSRVYKTGRLDPEKPIRKLGPRGEGTVSTGGYRMIWSGDRKVAEHRLIMEELLGRPLLKEENVHHLNGVRDDNRPANLELWSHSQPKGQRVEDKVAWARQIIDLYGDDFVQPRLLLEGRPN